MIRRRHRWIDRRTFFRLRAPMEDENGRLSDEWVEMDWFGKVRDRWWVI